MHVSRSPAPNQSNHPGIIAKIAQERLEYFVNTAKARKFTWKGPCPKNWLEINPLPLQLLEELKQAKQIGQFGLVRQCNISKWTEEGRIL